jgi:ADYC domain
VPGGLRHGYSGAVSYRFAGGLDLEKIVLQEAALDNLASRTVWRARGGPPQAPREAIVERHARCSERGVMRTHRAIRPRGWMLIGVMAACDSPAPDPGACFPVPRNAEVTSIGESELGGCTPDLVPGGSCQGTSLQGEGSLVGQPEQGTSLQGCPPSLLPGETCQGTSLQGGTSAFQPEQGTSLQGTGALRSTSRSLADLDGVRLALISGEAVVMRDGELVAPGFADTAKLQGVGIVGTTVDGRSLAISIAVASRIAGTTLVVVTVDGAAVCGGGPGVFVPGRFTDTGARVDDPSAVTFSCTDGVIAKCVDFGYAPWTAGSDVHLTCTRLARADYCGDGTPWTLDGTLVTIFDRLGIRSLRGGGTSVFEAAWGPDGAVCVARTRYEVHDGDGRPLRPRCFASLPTCTTFDDPAAAGALIANESHAVSIDACP